MAYTTIALWTVLVAFALEEFVLIKPVSTIEQSDSLSRRLELTSIWLPAIAIGVTTARLHRYGGVRLGGSVNALGLLLCIVGLGLRYWSRRTIRVVKQEGHVVIQSGPYRFVRHPGYLAFILFYLGLALLTGSWLGVLILSVPASLIFIWLSWVEDEQLAERIGDEYRHYSEIARVWFRVFGEMPNRGLIRQLRQCSRAAWLRRVVLLMSSAASVRMRAATRHGRSSTCALPSRG
jgi:protein-S-isoprenylcysteine O-methyltransferase Ste14